MALLKEIISKQGIKLTYWRIGQRIIDPIKKEIHFELLPYIDEQTRRDGHEPFESEKIRVDMYDCSPKLIKVLNDDGIEEEQIIQTHVFDDYFSPQALEASGKNEVEASYIYAKENLQELADAIDC